MGCPIPALLWSRIKMQSQTFFSVSATKVRKYSHMAIKLQRVSTIGLTHAHLQPFQRQHYHPLKMHVNVPRPYSPFTAIPNQCRRPQSKTS